MRRGARAARRTLLARARAEARTDRGGAHRRPCDPPTTGGRSDSRRASGASPARRRNRFGARQPCLRRNPFPCGNGCSARRACAKTPPRSAHPPPYRARACAMRRKCAAHSSRPSRQNRPLSEARRAKARQAPSSRDSPAPKDARASPHCPRSDTSRHIPRHVSSYRRRPPAS